MLQEKSCSVLEVEITATMQTAFVYDGVPRCAAQFTGKERDSETQLDYFGTRFYGGVVARFLRSDPHQTSGFQHMSDPQSWNGYSYARSEPLLYIDPDGLNYQVCDNNGRNCADLDNAQFAEYLKENPNVTVSPSGQLSITVNGTTQKIGTAAYYNEQTVKAARMLAQTGATLGDVRTIGGFYGLSALLGVSFYAAGTYEAGFTTLELSGGGEILTNQAAGQIIGWGTGQEGATATEQLTNSLTKKAVQQMIDKGLNKSTVQNLIFKYGRAIAEGGGKLNNTQLMPRYQLMMRILELWPK